MEEVPTLKEPLPPPTHPLANKAEEASITVNNMSALTLETKGNICIGSIIDNAEKVPTTMNNAPSITFETEINLHTNSSADKIENSLMENSMPIATPSETQVNVCTGFLVGKNNPSFSLDAKAQNALPYIINQHEQRLMYNKLYPVRVGTTPRIVIQDTVVNDPLTNDYVIDYYRLGSAGGGRFSLDHTFFSRLNLTHDMYYLRNIYRAAVVKQGENQYALGILKKKWKVEEGEIVILFGKNRELAEKRYAFLKQKENLFNLIRPGDEAYPDLRYATFSSSTFREPMRYDPGLNNKLDALAKWSIPLGEGYKAQDLLDLIKEKASLLKLNIWKNKYYYAALKFTSDPYEAKERNEPFIFLGEHPEEAEFKLEFLKDHASYLQIKTERSRYYAAYKPSSYDFLGLATKNKIMLSLSNNEEKAKLELEKLSNDYNQSLLALTYRWVNQAHCILKSIKKSKKKVNAITISEQQFSKIDQINMDPYFYGHSHHTGFYAPGYYLKLKPMNNKLLIGKKRIRWLLPPKGIEKRNCIAAAYIGTDANAYERAMQGIRSMTNYNNLWRSFRLSIKKAYFDNKIHQVEKIWNKKDRIRSKNKYAKINLLAKH